MPDETHIKSVTVKTGPPDTADEEVLGYELVKSEDVESAMIIRTPTDKELNGRQIMLVSSARRFPAEVQTTIKPYIDRAGFSSHLSDTASDTVKETDVRVLIETADEDQYNIQKLDSNRYYTSHDGQLVDPPETVVQKAQQVFPNYEPVLG